MQEYKKYKYSSLSVNSRNGSKWQGKTIRELQTKTSSRMFISVCMAWLQRTWLSYVRLSLRQQVVVAVFGPSQPANWSYHAADCQPTAPVRSVSLVQSAGMPYRII